MKNIEQLYETLDDSNIESELKRNELSAFLKEQASMAVKDNSIRKDIAYDIAGLLSTRYALELNINDLTDQILTLAGELEVDDDSGKWEELIGLIEKF